MIVTIKGRVRLTKERTSKKGNKFYAVLLKQNSESIWINSSKPIPEGPAELECEIVKSGEYLNISCF